MPVDAVDVHVDETRHDVALANVDDGRAGQVRTGLGSMAAIRPLSMTSDAEVRIRSGRTRSPPARTSMRRLSRHRSQVTSHKSALRFAVCDL